MPGGPYLARMYGLPARHLLHETSSRRDGDPLRLEPFRRFGDAAESFLHRCQVPAQLDEDELLILNHRQPEGPMESGARDRNSADITVSAALC